MIQPDGQQLRRGKIQGLVTGKLRKRGFEYGLLGVSTGFETLCSLLVSTKLLLVPGRQGGPLYGCPLTFITNDTGFV